MIKEVIILFLLPWTIVLFHHSHFGTCDENEKIRFQITPPTPSFYGRSEFLHQLHESIERSKLKLLEPSESSSQSSTLLAGQQSSIIKIVVGDGGLGKTELVRKYVETYGQANYDHLIWLNGNSFENGGGKKELLTPPFLALAAHELVQVSTVEEKNGASSTITTITTPPTTTTTNEDGESGKQEEEEIITIHSGSHGDYHDGGGGDELKPIKEIVQEIYLKISQRDALVVFDDIEVKSGSNENPLKIFLPLQLPRPLKQPVILIVSKTEKKIWEEKNWDGSSPSSGDGGLDNDPEIFKLEGFSPEENVGFILQELRSLKEKFANQDLATMEEDARQLGELLHGIPLALQLAIAYIKNGEEESGGSVIENYIQIFQTVMLERRSEGRGQSQNPMATAWLVTRKKLEEDFEGSFAVEIMETLAFLSDEETRENFLFAVSSSSSVSKKLEEKSLTTAENENHEQNFFTNCLKLLQKYGLLLITKETTMTAAAEKGEDQNRIIRCQKQIQIVVMDNLRMGHLEHLKVLMERAEKFVARQQLLVTTTPKLGNGTPILLSHLKCMEILAGKVAALLSSSSHMADYGKFKLLAFKPKIALVYEEIGDSKNAKNLLQEFFEELNEIMDSYFDHSVTEQEWLMEAIFDQFFDLHLNKFMRNESTSAIAVTREEGEQKTEKFLNLICAISEKVLGDSHPGSIWLFQKMAETLTTLKLFGKALILYRKIYEIQTELLLNMGSEKGESPQSVATLHKIAETLANAGQFDEAIGVYLDLYDIEKTASSRRRHSDPEKLTTPIHKLALTLADRKEFQKSLTLFKLLVQLQETALGRQNPATLSSIRDLAGVHLLEENFDMAIRIFDHAHHNLNHTLGPSHLDTIKAKQDLANAFAAAGQVEKSRKLLQEIYTLRQKSLGSDHIESIESLEDLSQIVLKQGELRKAKELFTKLYQYRIKKFGEEHLDTMATLEKIGLINLGQMKYEDALQNFQKVAQIRQQILGLNHPATSPSLIFEGTVLFLMSSHQPIKEKKTTDGDGGQTVSQKSGLEQQKAIEIFKNQFELGKTSDAIMEKIIESIQQISHILKFDQQKDVGKSLQFLDSIYRSQTEMLGPDSHVAILTLQEMAQLLIHRGKYTEASKVGRKLIKISKQKFGLNHPDTLRALQVQATVDEKRERFKEAELTYREMYAMSQKIFGNLHWKSITLLRKIGELLRDQKRVDHSASVMEEVYQLRLKSAKTANDFGGRSLAQASSSGQPQPEDDIDVLSAQSDLAMAYSLQKKYEDALKLYLKIYEKRNQVLGTIHVDTMASYEKVADMLMELGGVEEAGKAYKKIYQVKRKIFGLVHNETNSVLFKMVTIHEIANDTREALRVLKLACERQMKLVSGPAATSATDLSCDTRMADLYRLRGNHSEALKLGWKILKNRRATLGETHDETLKTKLMVAELYHVSHKLDFAEDLYEDVYKRRVKILGPEHPDSLAVLEKIAIMTNNDLKNYPEALELYTTIYESSRKKFGEENLDSIRYLDIIAQVRHNLRDFEGSLETSRKVYKLRSKVLGEEHEDSLNTLKNIAVLLCEQGDCKGEKGGLKILEKVLRVKRRTLGKDHPDTKQLAAAVKDIKDRMAAEAEAEEKRKTPQFKIHKVDL